MLLGTLQKFRVDQQKQADTGKVCTTVSNTNHYVRSYVCMVWSSLLLSWN